MTSRAHPYLENQGKSGCPTSIPPSSVPLLLWGSRGGVGANPSRRWTRGGALDRSAAYPRANIHRQIIYSRFTERPWPNQDSNREPSCWDTTVLTTIDQRYMVFKKTSFVFKISEIRKYAFALIKLIFSYKQNEIWQTLLCLDDSFMSIAYVPENEHHVFIWLRLKIRIFIKLYFQMYFLLFYSDISSCIYPVVFITCSNDNIIYLII